MLEGCLQSLLPERGPLVGVVLLGPAVLPLFPLQLLSIRAWITSSRWRCCVAIRCCT